LEVRIAENMIFVEKTFAGCLLLPCQRTLHPQILWRKLLANSHKTVKFAKVFSLESFSLYSMFLHIVYIWPWFYEHC